MKKKSGIEKLRDFIRFHAHQVQDHRDVMNLYIRESRYFTEPNRKIFKDNQREYSYLMVKLIQQIQKENRAAFKGLDPKVVANSILGMMNYAVIWYKGRDSSRAFT